MLKLTFKRLIIAEKSDMGRAIADFLWPKKDYNDNKTYVEKDGIAISWAAGHLYYLAQPADYGYPTWNYYPVYPVDWEINPYANKSVQLSVLKDLLSRANEVVHAGDPDREGQCIVDEILDKCCYKGPVKRILPNAKDNSSLKRAFDAMDDNANHKNMYIAAQARQRADWLVGMNLSRCYQEQAKKYGLDERWRVGRVKMPTLALVVQRERDLQSFSKHYFYELQTTFQKENVPIRAKLVPSDKLNLDEKGRVLEKTVLQAIATKVKMSAGIVKNYKRSTGAEYPPLPYSMDKLQVEANKKYHLSPKKVLDIVESLYLAKLVSYPRSDCNYIPKAQLEDSPKIIEALKKYGLNVADKADLSIIGKAWNDSKITAHHAIIPTGVLPANLDSDQDKVYKLIGQRYIMQFLHPCKFETAEYTIIAADETFRGSCKHILDYGYKGVGLGESNTEDDNLIDVLPNLAEGENLGLPADCRIDAKETKPPKRFTAGTLISAMTDIWRYMSSDNPNRDKLKEIKGLGTPATRDGIIEDLLATTIKGKLVRPMLKEIKNELIPTAFGFYVVDNIGKNLTVPDATALMEYKLAEVEAGKYDIASFLEEIKCMVNENIDYAEHHQFPPDPEGKPPVECPHCHNGNLIKCYSKATKAEFFLCNNKECKNPYNNKPYYYNVGDDGEPIIGYCPVCKNVMDRAKGPYGFFWKCPHCNKNYRDKNGMPDFSQKPNNTFIKKPFHKS